MIVLHPILRYASALSLLVVALVFLAISATINIHSISWLVGIYCCLLVTLFSFRQQGNEAVLKTYRTYMSCMGLYFMVVWLLHVCIPVSKPPVLEDRVVLWAQILRAGTIFLPVCFLRFTRHFTGSANQAMRLLEIAAWLLSFGFYACNWLGMFAVGYRWSGKTWAPIMGGAYVPFTYFTLIVIGVSTVYSVICLIKNKDYEYRARLFYFLIGSIPMWLTITANFLLSLGINIYPAAGVFFIVHVSILAYAVLRRKVFAVAISLRRGAAYAVASLVLGIAYGGVLWLLTFGTGLNSYSTNVLVTALFMAFSGFFLAPFVDLVQTILDRGFFRLSANRQHAFDALAQTTAGNISLPKITSALTDFLTSTLSSRTVWIYLETPKGQLALYSKGHGEETAWPDSLILEPNLAEQLDMRNMVEIEPTFPLDRINPLELVEQEKGLLAKVSHRDKRLGCVLLGARLSDEPYSDSDKELIRTALAHISLAMANALAFKQLEEIQSQTLRTLNGLNAGVLSLEHDGRVLQINDAARHILGIENQNASIALKTLWPMQPLLANAIQNTLDSGSELLNQELSLEGPTHVLLSIQVHRQSNQSSRVVVLLHDITDYKKMEDLVRKRAGLAEAGEMLAAINHEIRNVLQPIKYQVRVLGRSNPKSPEEQRAMDVVTERISAMDQLLENLRNLARPIELRRRCVDIKHLLESVWNDVKGIPISNGMALQVISNGHDLVNADAHWLRQVLYNLIRNAVESSHANQATVVDARVAGDTETVEIHIQDRGAGIPLELIGRLFQPFVSGKGAAGTGLGLSISRRIIELHQGTISAQNNAEGALFIIRLPRGQCPALPSVPVANETSK